MSKTYCQKMEHFIGRFIWSYSGKVLRVAIGDLKLPVSRGGLNLTCMNTMARSLKLSLTLKLLKSEDKKSVGHLWFWIGECLTEFMPHLSSWPQNNVPVFFESLAQIVTDARIAEAITVLNWRMLSNKKIYRKFMELFFTC